MGMYNEVFAPCPKCGSYGYLQIYQMVMGFGGFYLDRPESMLELSEEQLKELKDIVEKEGFNCEDHMSKKGCGHFRWNEKGKKGKLELINSLFGGES